MENKKKKNYNNKRKYRKSNTSIKKEDKKEINEIEENVEVKETDDAIDNLFDKNVKLETYDFVPPENYLIENVESDTNEQVEEVAKEELDKVEESYETIETPIEETVLEPEENVEVNSDVELKQPEIEVLDNTKKEEVKSSFYLSYNARLLINIVCIVVFMLLSVFLLISSISIKARSNVLYRQTSNLDYKVYLKPNDFYKEPFLSKNMQYIASIIDNVDVDFNYNFNVNQLIDYKYTYYIKADVAVTDPQDETKIIYSKSDKLTEPNTIDMQNSVGFNIAENVKIDYAKYNDLVKAFKSSYGINANSNLTLSLCLEIVDSKGNMIKSLDSETMKLIIPLTEQMIDIKMDYKEINNSNNVNIYKDFNISNKITFALSIISFIAMIVFIIKLVIFMNRTAPKKTIYDTTLARILREYDRVIVNSRKLVDLSDHVIDVDNFNELLDVRDNLEKPIIFSEIHKRQKSVFIVKTAHETYRYILKLVDLEKEQENEKKM